MELASSACPGVGMTPSCCIMPKASKFCHPSSILPPEKRVMAVPVIVILSPIGGIPMSSPSCVPLAAVHRYATLSPSATASSKVV